MVIEQTELPRDDVKRARSYPSTVVVLPRKRADDGRGIYDEATVFLAKELRADGLNVAYLDNSEDRLFEVKKSALITILLSFALGLGSSAAWDGIKAVLKRNYGEDQPIEITYIELKREGPRAARTVRGPSKDVLEAIDRLREQGDD